MKKKTPRVSGYLIVGLISLIAVGSYFAIKNDSYTYVSCIENTDDSKKYIAFNNNRLLFGWDQIEEEFKRNIEIIEFSKKKIKAKFYVEKLPNNVIDTFDSKPIGEPIIVSEAYISLDRETGEYQLSFEDSGMRGNREDCTKINKSDLPVKKIKQKF